MLQLQMVVTLSLGPFVDLGGFCYPLAMNLVQLKRELAATATTRQKLN